MTTFGTKPLLVLEPNFLRSWDRSPALVVVANSYFMDVQKLLVVNQAVVLNLWSSHW